MNKIHFIMTLCVGIALGYLLNTLLQESNAADNASIKSHHAIDEHTIDENVDDQILPASFDQDQLSNSSLEKKAPPTNSKLETKAINDGKLSYQALEQQFKQLQHEFMLLEQQLASLEVTTISNDQMAGLVDNNFSNTLKYLQGKLRNDVYNFHQQEEDLDWGYIMSNNIINFVSTHYQSVDIEIDSISCKQPHCELRIIEKEASTWQKISQDMRQQPWWTFTSTNSSKSIDPTQNNTLIYSFLKTSS